MNLCTALSLSAWVWCCRAVSELHCVMECIVLQKTVRGLREQQETVPALNMQSYMSGVVNVRARAGDLAGVLHTPLEMNHAD